MSAGIAILGLLLSSPAVVIGAMLISPLMGPIVGLGFGLATFDGTRSGGQPLALSAPGVVLALVFCSLFIALLSPLRLVTSEISSRTRPNLFDLLVALFSGLAGTYAVIRGRHGAIVGRGNSHGLDATVRGNGFRDRDGELARARRLVPVVLH